MKGLQPLFLGIFGIFAFSWLGMTVIPNLQIGSSQSANRRRRRRCLSRPAFRHGRARRAGLRREWLRLLSFPTSAPRLRRRLISIANGENVAALHATTFLSRSFFSAECGPDRISPMWDTGRRCQKKERPHHRRRLRPARLPQRERRQRLRQRRVPAAAASPAGTANATAAATPSAAAGTSSPAPAGNQPAANIATAAPTMVANPK